MNTQNIKFNDEEQWMVASLRKRERDWRCWGKWLTLLCGVASGLCCLYSVYVLAKLPSEWQFPEARRLAVITSRMFIFLVTVGLGVISVYMISFAIRDWHGNTTRTLLLKLIDYSCQEKISNDRTG